jgi:hypothetical protein
LPTILRELIFFIFAEFSLLCTSSYATEHHHIDFKIACKT